MTSLAVSKEDWLILAPLLDCALDLPVATRERWVNQQMQLTGSQQATLRALLAVQDSPETLQLLDPQAVLGLRSAAMRLQQRDAASYQEGQAIGPYRLLRLLGRGGMGEVWLAQRVDGTFDRTVALKLCDADDPSRRIRERMLRERDVLASLEHPGIARFYDAGVSDSGASYIAMEYVEGVPLNVHVGGKALDVEVVCRLMVQILAAIHYAHQHLIVHRDLKPGNVMVRPNGQVSLLDFGIAKILDPETRAGELTLLTQEGGRALTPAYASPEQCRGQAVSTASDVFSAGVMLYELLAGVRPFQRAEASLLDLCRAHTEAIPRISTLPRRLQARDLNAIVGRALRERAEDRYQSAAEFADDLHRVLDNQPVVAVRGARWYVFAKFVRRHVAAVTIATVAMLGLLAFVVLLYAQYQESERLRQRAQTVERIMGGVFAGLNPVSSDAQLTAPKELLDRSVGALGDTALDPTIAMRLAAVYRRLDLPDSALSVLEKSLDHARSTSRRDFDAERGALAAAATLLAERRQFTRAEDLLTQAREHHVGRWTSAPESLWQVALATGRVQIEKGNIAEAASALLSARRLAMEMGHNELDALTITIDQQAELARKDGNWARSLDLLQEADAVARQFGEIDPLLAFARARARAVTQLAIGDAAAAAATLSPHFDEASRRYPFGHIHRLEAGIMLVHALLRAGETARADAVQQKLRPLHPNVLADRYFLNFYNYEQRKGKTEQEQARRMMEAIFVSSVIRERSDLRLIDERNRLLRTREPAGQGVAGDLAPEPMATVLQRAAAVVAPVQGATRQLGLAPKDRARLALSLAQTLVGEGRVDEATSRLQFAMNLLDDDAAGHSIDVDEIRTANAVLHLRRKEFAQSKVLLDQVQASYAASLPPGSPRHKLLAVYRALADVGESPTSTIAFDALQTQIVALRASTISAKEQQRIEKWLAMGARNLDWSNVPLLVL